jgi:hypothetical protein
MINRTAQLLAQGQEPVDLGRRFTGRTMPW